MKNVKHSDSRFFALYKARILKGLTQSKVAEMSHINKGYYSLIEAGKYFPSNDVLKEICHNLGIEDWKQFLD